MLTRVVAPARCARCAGSPTGCKRWGASSTWRKQNVAQALIGGSLWRLCRAVNLTYQNHVRQLHASVVKLAEKHAWPASEPTGRSSFDMPAPVLLLAACRAPLCVAAAQRLVCRLLSVVTMAL